MDLDGTRMGWRSMGDSDLYVVQSLANYWTGCQQRNSWGAELKDLEGHRWNQQQSHGVTNEFILKIPPQSPVAGHKHHGRKATPGSAEWKPR